MDKFQLKSFTLHLLFFVTIEIIFVFILFREIPETNIFSAIGVGHLIYWIILLGAAFVRKKANKVWQRFLATYTPVVVHLLIHLRVGIATINTHNAYHEQETGWIIAGVIIIGALIYRGELLLHRKYHCETHHQHDHTKCLHNGHADCEKNHEKANKKKNELKAMFGF